MRIVHVSPFYYPIIGGVETVVKKVCEYLASRGYDVYVVTYKRLRKGKINALPRKEEINGVKIVRLKPNLTWEHGSYSHELPNTLRELRPDIVHVHVWRHPHVFQVLELKKKLGFKAILHTHAPFYRACQVGFITWTYYKLVDTFLGRVMKMFDSVIAITPLECKILREYFGVDNVLTIPNGIEDELLKLAYSKCCEYILYVGRIAREKNLELLIKALEFLNDIEIRLVGPSSDYLGKLTKLIKKQRLRVFYEGALPRSELLERYRRCCLFVNPSLYEGFCIALLEAQAFGKPCVITGWGGQLYTAPPGITSLWARPDPKDFAYAIRRVLEDRRLYVKLSENARAWASMHVWSRILPKYEKVYAEIITTR